MSQNPSEAKHTQAESNLPYRTMTKLSGALWMYLAILTGAMGWFIGRYVWKTHQDHAMHPHGGVKAWVLPQIQPGSGTYALSLQIQP